MILNKDDLSAFLAETRKTHSTNYFYFSYFQQIENLTWNDLKNTFLNNKANYFFCCQPSIKFSLMAYDELISITEDFSVGYSSIKNTYTKVQSHFYSNAAKYNVSKNPLLFGTIKFPSKRKEQLWSDFPESKWFIPKFYLLKDDERYFFVINALYYEGVENYLELTINNLAINKFDTPARKNFYSKLSESNFNDWSVKIDYALKNISDGTIKKIVLARLIDLELFEYPLINKILEDLEKKYSNCCTFACKSGKSIFFGATPEKLFSLANGMLHADALAGSCPRGNSDSADRKLQDELLHDNKNLNEHNAVTTFLTEQLSALVENFTVEKKPVVRKLTNIQHLYTPVKAEIKASVSFFDVLEKLFPTPAVCGIPPLKAKELIDEIEEFERGLYAGAIGWLGLNNSAEMYVGIRSALLKGTHVRAFAGGGIVEGSESKEEFNETNLKLKPILSLFENENIG